LLWVIGYAILTKNFYSVIIVAVSFVFFSFANIQKLDKRFSEKKEGQFDDVNKKKTKRFIIFYILM